MQQALRTVVVVDKTRQAKTVGDLSVGDMFQIASEPENVFVLVRAASKEVPTQKFCVAATIGVVACSHMPVNQIVYPVTRAIASIGLAIATHSETPVPRACVMLGNLVAGSMFLDGNFNLCLYVVSDSLPFNTVRIGAPETWTTHNSTNVLLVPDFMIHGS